MSTPTNVDMHPVPSFGAVFRSHLKVLYYTLRRERWIFLVVCALFTIAAANQAHNFGTLLRAKDHSSPFATCLQASQQPKAQTSVNAIKYLIGPLVTQLTVRDDQGRVIADCITTAGMDSLRKVAFAKSMGTPQGGSQATITIQQSSEQSSSDNDKRMAEMVAQSERAGIVAVVLVLIGAVTFRMWRGDSVSKRVYFLSMPVRREEHAVLKMLAGWCWFVGVMVLSVLLIAVITAFSEAYFSYLGVLQQWEEPAVNFILSDVLGPFTVLTICYLLVSALSVGFKSPGYWLIGLALAESVLPPILTYLKWHAMSHAVTAIWTGRYGLLHIVPVFVDNYPPDVSRWWITTALWMGVGLAAFLAAAYARRPIGLRA